MSTRRCLATINVYGHPLTDTCNSGGYHVPAGHTCPSSFQEELCSHHHPVYDHLEAFVIQERTAAKAGKKL